MKMGLFSGNIKHSAAGSSLKGKVLFAKKKGSFLEKVKKKNLSFFQGKVLFGPRKAILTFPLFPIFCIFVKRKVPRCEYIFKEPFLVEYIFKEPFLLHLEPFAYE